MAEHILVIEDAEPFQLLATEILGRAGYDVAIAETGARGLELARSLKPAVILLDLVLPDADGIELCGELRTFTDAYVVMVTSKDDEIDKLAGLAAGADDYVTKPFSGKELVARIGVVLRRPRISVNPVRILGDVTVDSGAREVRVAGNSVSFTKIEFDLLDALTLDASRVLSRSELMEAVWGAGWVGDTHVIDVHLGNLRKKLDANGTKHIKTVRGVGYRFADPDAAAQAA